MRNLISSLHSCSHPSFLSESLGARWRIFFLALSLSVLSSRPSPAQEEVRPLRLEGITLNGPHPALTENWVTIEVTVGNVNAMGRDGRVVVFYADQKDVQYARTLSIPPRSSLRTWMLVGPAPPSAPLSAFARAEPKGVPARELH